VTSSRALCQLISPSRSRPIPNTFAYVALLAWPAVCIGLFIALPIERAAIWSLLGGFLLLPSGTQIDLPLLPPIDKMSVPALSALLLCWMKGTQVPAPRPSTLLYLLAIGYILSPLFTSLGNSYELQIAGVSIPGFYPLDGLKLVGRNILMLAPFYIGSRFLCTDDARGLLLKAVPIAALFYSLPMLFEIRMSPQLHRWVYGYFPHQFAQTMRDGGFRPVVFLDQGIQLALFVSMAVIAAVVLARGKMRIRRVSAAWISAYLAVLLLLCKTLAAAFYAAVIVPLVLVTRPRTWIKISCVLLLIICAYPALRTFDLIPVHHISQAATNVSLDRSKSFQTRVQNEDKLLAKANDKPLFGWGAWGRNRIYDRDTGQNVSITDGGWIIEFGSWGWLGYLSIFGLLTVAAFSALGAVGKEVTPASVTLGGLSLLLAVNLIDMLPNANFTPITLLIAGSIANAARVRARRRTPVRRPRNDSSAPTAATVSH